MVTYYLKKTLTANGNTYGFAATDYQFEMDTATSKITEGVQKQFAAIVLRPRSRKNWSNFAPHALLIDLKQVKHTFTITGVLLNDDGNLSNITQNENAVPALAMNKKNILIAMGEQGGYLTFSHRNFGLARTVDSNHPGNLSTTEETVNIVSLEFEDIETEAGTVVAGTSESAMRTGEVRISFTMVLQRGIDR